MAQNSASTAERFQSLNEQTQNDLKHDAWAQVAEDFVNEYEEQHDLLDRHDVWDGMELEIYEDEHGRKYFHKVTGVQHAPGHGNGERLSEAAHEFLNQYRSRLSELVSEQ